MLAHDSSLAQKVIDVFSISSFAPRGKCSKDDVDCVTKVRKAEELGNCKQVGAQVEFLPFQDSELRDHPRTFDESQDGSLEADLVRKIKGELKPRLSDSERVFFPLAIGRHVDHILVNRIGLELAVEEHILGDMYFYEDQPYSARKPREYGLMNLSLDEARFEQILLPFSWRKKWNLCISYDSQFSHKAFRRILRYSKRVRLFGTFYERIWKVKSEDYVERLITAQH